MSQEQHEADAAGLVLWEFHRVRESLAACDVIIGLGSYDTAVADECTELFHARLGQAIIFTGREGNWTAGKSSLTEAEQFSAVAIDKGVPPPKIILEKQATNIGQNVAFSQQLMDDKGWRSAIFVTKPQTMRRTRLTINRQSRLERTIVAAPDYTMDSFIVKFGREQLFNEMVGDLDRIIKYPALGFQEAVAVPAEVLIAFEGLKRRGFTKHLL